MNLRSMILKSLLICSLLSLFTCDINSLFTNEIRDKIDKDLETPTAAETFTVSYYANGATGDAPVDLTEYEISSIVTVMGNSEGMAKAGYLFGGWNTEPDGMGTDRSADSTFAMGTSHISLYAKWIYNFAGIEKREMISVPGVEDDSYTQSDNSGNSYIHNLSSFEIGKYEVTYELWYRVHDWALSNGFYFANPGREGGGGVVTDPEGAAPTANKYQPVTTVNWRDAIVWCNAYSIMSGYKPVYLNGNNQVIKDSRDSNSLVCDGAVAHWNHKGFRLLTEGEFQYAAGYIDGSSRTPGNHASGAYTYYNDIEDVNPANSYPDGKDANDQVAVYSTYWDGSAWIPNGSISPVEVGTKAANQLQIFDISGNVLEWCWDLYDLYPVGVRDNYRGVSSSDKRVIRGGSSYCPAVRLAVGTRYNSTPDSEHFSFGFRVSRSQ